MPLAPEPEPRWRTLLAGALTLSVFGAFLAYYAVSCLNPDWGGDFQMYCAGVARLYRDLSNPGHEAMAVPGEQSSMYTPYLVLIAVLGRSLHATPFGALQAAGVFNLVLFAVAVCFLFSRASSHRHWWLAAACFLFTTLCLRWAHWGWSSETSLTNFQYIQPYPSTFAWALAFLAFGLLDTLWQRWRWLEAVLLGVIVSVLLMTHALTGSWVAGIVGLYGLWASLVGRTRAPLLRAVAVLCAALVPASVWPYAPFFGQGSLLGINEGAPFGSWPWVDFPNLYALALPCFAYLWLRLRRHAFWFLGMLATLAMLGLWRAVGFSFGNRYALFAAFFAQFAVAEVMAFGLSPLPSTPTDLAVARPLAKVERPTTVALLLAALTIWLPSPMLSRARQTREFGTLWSPAEILGRPSAHARYYGQFAELEPHLSPADLVLTPISRAVFDLASVTGVSVVRSPSSHGVPDRHERTRDVRAFFHAAAPPELRSSILRKYGVSKVVATRQELALVPALTQLLGEPLHCSENYAVYRVDP